ncbi:MAG: acetamidase/formamidase family protein, partial [Acidobacteriota bacterium]
MKSLVRHVILSGVALVIAVVPLVGAEEPLVLMRQGQHCTDDPNCFNRFHPDIPMNSKAKPGQLIVMDVRNAGDLELDASGEWTLLDPPGSTVHPITGPV